MKALEKDRRRRYETANDFAADVLNYLADRPVEAVPPSTWYRLTKFTRRNRLALAAAGVVGAAVCLAVVALGVSAALIARERAEAVRQRNTAQWQRDEAQRQREIARRAVDEMYTQVAEKWLGHQPKMTAVQREFLEKALAFFEQFAAEHADDPKAVLDAARARRQAASIRATLGKAEEAGTAYRQAIAECEDLARRYPGEPPYRRELSSCLTGLAIVQVRLGRLSEAEALFRRSVAIVEELSTEYPDVVDDRRRLVGGLHNLALTCYRQGRLEEAESLLRRGRQLAEPFVKGLKSSHAWAREYLATVEEALGNLLKNTKRPQEAEQAYRRSLELNESLLADNPTDPGARRGVPSSLINLGTLYANTGRWKEALANFRRAEPMLEALASDFPDHLDIRHRLATVRLDLVSALLVDQNLKEAEQVARRGLELGQELVRDHPDVPDHRSQLAQFYLKLAGIFEKDRPDQAEEHRGRSYEILDRLVSDFPQSAEYRKKLAMACCSHVDTVEGRLRKPGRDLERVRRAVELDPKEQYHWRWLAVAEYATGHWDAAIRAAEKCIELRGDEGWSFLWLTLALAHERRGDAERARAWYAKARPAIEQGRLVDTPRWMVDEASRLFGEHGPGISEESRPTPKAGTKSK
jgi:tetratricopeptide (TPR) repeat protein